MRNLLAAIAAMAIAGTPAHADSVRISNLSDMAFTPSNLTVDATQSETVCAYSTLLLGRYSVTATGDGPGGAFSVTDGSYRMPYEVQWSSASNQTSGTQMTSGQPLSGMTSGAATPGCLAGLLSSGSLTVVFRSADLMAAEAGSYSGTLTILLSAN